MNLHTELDRFVNLFATKIEPDRTEKTDFRPLYETRKIYRFSESRFPDCLFVLVNFVV